MQVLPCLHLAFATKEVLKEEDSNHPAAFFFSPPNSRLDVKNQAEVSQTG